MADTADDVLKELGMAPPAADGGTPPATEGGDGSGTPPATPPADGGTPPADAGTPPPGGTPPATEGGTPPAAGGTPPPAADAGTPPATQGADDGTPPPPPATDTPPAATDTPPATPAPLGDDALLEEIKKRTGRMDLKSLDELLAKPQTPEEKAAAEKKQKDEAVAYGLQNNLITTDALQAYIGDVNRTPREVALALFAQEERAADKEVTDEEIALRFGDFYHEGLPEDDPRRIRGQREMQSLAERHIAEAHKSVLGIEDTYRQHEEARTSATQYRQQVEQAFNTMPKEISLEIPFAGDLEADKKTAVNFKFTDASIKKIQEQFLTPQTFKMLKSGDMTEEGLKGAIETALIRDNLPRLIAEAANSHASKRVEEVRAGLAGLPPASGGGIPPSTSAENAEATKVMKDLGIPI